MDHSDDTLNYNQGEKDLKVSPTEMNLDDSNVFPKSDSPKENINMDDLDSDLSISSGNGSQESFHSFENSEHEHLINDTQGKISPFSLQDSTIVNKRNICESSPERISERSYSPAIRQVDKAGGYRRFTPGSPAAESTNAVGTAVGLSKIGSNRSSSGMKLKGSSIPEGISVPSSPQNELRQRLGSHDMTPSRARSYTSPESSSASSPQRRKSSPAGDARTTAFRRWILRTPEDRGVHRQSKAVRIAQSYNFDIESEGSQLSGTSFLDEDIFARSGLLIDPRLTSPPIESSSTHGFSHATGRLFPQTIQEEEALFSRQRTFSEPERSGRGSWRAFFRRNESSQLNTNLNTGGPSTTLRIPSASDSVFSESDAMLETSFDRSNLISFQLESTHDTRGVEMQVHGSTGMISDADESDRHIPDDPNREARRTWILINQRFQLVIMIVGIIFSFLIFAIMVTWVVLTSAYVVSIDDPCDLPLKAYFWLATVQLILDVFRIEIMRNILLYNPNEANRQIPTRVIFYNLAYLTYAMLVLRIGINSTFLDQGSTCPLTSKRLFITTRVFVSISLSAWLFILIGYLIPFCVVAILLTINGYSPAAELNPNAPNFGVFPISHSSCAAPTYCIDRMKHVKLEDFPRHYPTECCICLADFKPHEIIVATACEHVFHKRCCRDWLRQARTCPVCRMDIPNSLPNSDINEDSNDSRSRHHSWFSRGPFRNQELAHDLQNLVSMIRDSNRP